MGYNGDISWEINVTTRGNTSWGSNTLWLFNIAMVEMAHLYMMFVSDDDDDDGDDGDDDDDDDDSPIINRDLRILMWI